MTKITILHIKIDYITLQESVNKKTHLITAGMKE